MKPPSDNTLILIRGIPGSGKSTKALEIKNKKKPGHAEIYEADQYFEHNGQYCFDPKLISEAHQYCHTAVKQAMINQTDYVIVSNTFSQIWEMQKYFELAEQFNYKVRIYEMSSMPVLEGKQVNIHSVPQNVIDKMVKKWESVPPSLCEKHNITVMIF